jgi:hypothetical protein
MQEERRVWHGIHRPTFISDRVSLRNGIFLSSIMALVLFTEFHLTLVILTLHCLPLLSFRDSRFRLGRRILLNAQSRYFLFNHLRCSRDSCSEFPQQLLKLVIDITTSITCPWTESWLYVKGRSSSKDGSYDAAKEDNLAISCDDEGCLHLHCLTRSVEVP